MLGQPLYMVTPQVVGYKLTGALKEGVTATDLVLTVTQLLRTRRRSRWAMFPQAYPRRGRGVRGGLNSRFGVTRDTR